MWTGGGSHFAYHNQPNAAGKNFQTLTSAILPVLSADADVKVILIAVIALMTLMTLIHNPPFVTHNPSN